MRRNRAARVVIGATAAPIAALLALFVSACANRASSCEDNGDCGGSHGASTGAKGGGGGEGGDATTSTTGTAMTRCNGDPDSGNIDEVCAVFVKSGASGKKGTRADPLGDLDDAVALAAETGKRVYACGDFSGSLVVKKSFDLWGGFTCGSRWTWTGIGRSKLVAAADQVALVAANHGAASVHGFTISAPDATRAHGSSIAVVFGADAIGTVDRSEIAAGAGKEGTTMTGTSMVGANALPPSTSMYACGATTAATGRTLSCPDGKMLKGGDGGSGDIKVGNLFVAAHAGTGGTVDGQKVTDGGAAYCMPGHSGTVVGGAGDAGAGGLASDTQLLVGAIPSADLQVMGGAGKAGGPGGSGQPGGGGGGNGLNQPGDCAGGTGGGGMSGACGGGGGLAGYAGGSSIGIFALGPSLTLSTVVITVTGGGTGGDGTAGAAGGKGIASPASLIAGDHGGCAGGNGSDGGPGGPGGGGRGGHSLGVALSSKTAMAKLGNVADWTIGFAGGAGATLGPKHAEGGLRYNCWNFDANVECK